MLAKIARLALGLSENGVRVKGSVAAGRRMPVGEAVMGPSSLLTWSQSLQHLFVLSVHKLELDTYM